MKLMLLRTIRICGGEFNTKTKAKCLFLYSKLNSYTIQTIMHYTKLYSQTLTCNSVFIDPFIRKT